MFNKSNVNSNVLLNRFFPMFLKLNSSQGPLVFEIFFWVDAKVSADFFSFLCFKFLLKQNTINQQRIYHCYL